MRCPACGQRKGRRECPALGQTICAACCGSKRLVEINCPPQCGYLASAREHPAAVVRRQQTLDAAALAPTIRDLTERQHQLFFMFHAAIARYKPEGLTHLVDDDIAEAAGAFAATLETATRGVIYEHEASTSMAARLATELKGVLADIKERGGVVYDGEVAIVMRAIEAGAREVRTQGGGDRAYLTLVSRLLHVIPPPEPAGPQQIRSPLIVP